VTNLQNGRWVEVRINDRGPFVKGRKIDLSHKAARMLGIVKPGTAPVRLSALSVPAGSRPVGTPLQYYVQAGSYTRESNAERARARLASYYSDVRVDRLDTAKRRFYRVRMGAFATRSQAMRRAADAARFGYPMAIVTE
jgi:peptidoglycan lytic transglycosylase